MIELCKDPSGEVKLDSIPNKSVLGGTSQESKDRETITELRNTIRNEVCIKLKRHLLFMKHLILGW